MAIVDTPRIPQICTSVQRHVFTIGGGGGGGKPSRNCYLLLHLEDKIEKIRYTNTFQKLNLCVTLIKLHTR